MYETVYVPTAVDAGLLVWGRDRRADARCPLRAEVIEYVPRDVFNFAHAGVRETPINPCAIFLGNAGEEGGEDVGRRPDPQVKVNST